MISRRRLSYQADFNREIVGAAQRPDDRRESTQLE